MTQETCSSCLTYEMMKGDRNCTRVCSMCGEQGAQGVWVRVTAWGSTADAAGPEGTEWEQSVQLCAAVWVWQGEPLCVQSRGG